MKMHRSIILPGGHVTPGRRRTDVNVTPLRRIDVSATLCACWVVYFSCSGPTASVSGWVRACGINGLQILSYFVYRHAL